MSWLSIFEKMFEKSPDISVWKNVFNEFFLMGIVSFFDKKKLFVKSLLLLSHFFIFFFLIFVILITDLLDSLKYCINKNILDDIKEKLINYTEENCSKLYFMNSNQFIP